MIRLIKSLAFRIKIVRFARAAAKILAVILAFSLVSIFAQSYLFQKIMSSEIIKTVGPSLSVRAVGAGIIDFSFDSVKFMDISYSLKSSGANFDTNAVILRAKSFKVFYDFYESLKSTAKFKSLLIKEPQVNIVELNEFLNLISGISSSYNKDIVSNFEIPEINIKNGTLSAGKYEFNKISCDIIPGGDSSLFFNASAYLKNGNSYLKAFAKINTRTFDIKYFISADKILIEKCPEIIKLLSKYGVNNFISAETSLKLSGSYSRFKESGELKFNSSIKNFKNNLNVRSKVIEVKQVSPMFVSGFVSFNNKGVADYKIETSTGEIMVDGIKANIKADFEIGGKDKISAYFQKITPEMISVICNKKIFDSVCAIMPDISLSSVYSGNKIELKMDIAGKKTSWRRELLDFNFMGGTAVCSLDAKNLFDIKLLSFSLDSKACVNNSKIGNLKVLLKTPEKFDICFEGYGEGELSFADNYSNYILKCLFKNNKFLKNSSCREVELSGSFFDNKFCFTANGFNPAEFLNYISSISNYQVNSLISNLKKSWFAPLLNKNLDLEISGSFLKNGISARFISLFNDRTAGRTRNFVEGELNAWLNKNDINYNLKLESTFQTLLNTLQFNGIVKNIKNINIFKLDNKTVEIEISNSRDIDMIVFHSDFGKVNIGLDKINFELSPLSFLNIKGLYELKNNEFIANINIIPQNADIISRHFISMLNFKSISIKTEENGKYLSFMTEHNQKNNHLSFKFEIPNFKNSLTELKFQNVIIKKDLFEFSGIINFNISKNIFGAAGLLSINPVLINNVKYQNILTRFCESSKVNISGSIFTFISGGNIDIKIEKPDFIAAGFNLLGDLSVVVKNMSVNSVNIRNIELKTPARASVYQVKSSTDSVDEIAGCIKAKSKYLKSNDKKNTKKDNENYNFLKIAGGIVFSKNGIIDSANINYSFKICEFFELMPFIGYFYHDVLTLDPKKISFISEISNLTVNGQLGCKNSDVVSNEFDISVKHKNNFDVSGIFAADAKNPLIYRSKLLNYSLNGRTYKASAYFDTEHSSGLLEFYNQNVLFGDLLEKIFGRKNSISGNLNIKSKLSFADGKIKISTNCLVSDARIDVDELKSIVKDNSKHSGLNALLDINVKFSGSNYIFNKDLQALVEGEIDINGDAKQPLISGKLEGNRGKINYFGKVFNITSSSFSLSTLQKVDNINQGLNNGSAFEKKLSGAKGQNKNNYSYKLMNNLTSADPYKALTQSSVKNASNRGEKTSIEVAMSISASYRIREFDIYLNINGSDNKMTSNLTSNPELSQDAIYMLMYGIKPTGLSAQAKDYNDEITSNKVIDAINTQFQDVIYQKIGTSLEKKLNLDEVRINSYVGSEKYYSSNKKSGTSLDGNSGIGGGLTGSESETNSKNGIMNFNSLADIQVKIGKYVDPTLYLSYSKNLNSSKDDSIGMEYKVKEQFYIDGKVNQSLEYNVGAKYGIPF